MTLKDAKLQIVCSFINAKLFQGSLSIYETRRQMYEIADTMAIELGYRPEDIEPPATPAQPSEIEGLPGLGGTTFNISLERTLEDEENGAQPEGQPVEEGPLTMEDIEAILNGQEDTPPTEDFSDVSSVPSPFR